MFENKIHQNQNVIFANPHPGNINARQSDRKPNKQLQFLPMPEKSNKSAMHLSVTKLVEFDS
jgi:hypothetical protein